MSRHPLPHRPALLPGAVLCLALALAGCASRDQQRLNEAATSPLSDLNLLPVAIPEPLKKAQAAPYAWDAATTCAALQEELTALDETLGPDVDAPRGADPTLPERAGTLTTDVAVQTVHGLVPYRGWLRKLTGAERAARHVAEAVTAGQVRRGFLKGVLRQRGC
jgi:outer membrane murein-binding lipoprotein Lpp